MRRLIITCMCLTSCLLSACIHLYHPSIQQGNIIYPAQVERIRLGMSKDAVAEALGSPVLANTFDDNHWPYVYTFQNKGGAIVKKQLDLYFRNGHLVQIEGDFNRQTVIQLFHSY